MANYYSSTMMDAIRKEVTSYGNFFGEKFFAREVLSATTHFTYDVITSGAKSAPLVSRGAQSTKAGGLAYENKSFAILKILKPGHVITPDDLDQRLPGYTEYDTPEKIADLQNLSYAELSDSITATTELLRVNALTTGKASAYDENGAAYTMADYWDGDGTDPALTVDASDQWNATGKTAKDILMSIMQWKSLINAHHGSAPATLVVSEDVGIVLSGALLEHSPSALLEAGKLDATRAYADEGIQPLGRFAGLDIYSCGGTIDGVPILPAGSAILGSTGANVQVYGPTDVPTGDGKFSRVVGKRTMYTHGEEDPVAYKNILQSAPCPVIRRKWDCLYIKEILSTT